MDLTIQFRDLVTAADHLRSADALPLDHAALLIAAHANPAVDVVAQLQRLDDLAGQLTDPSLDTLRDLVFEDLQFRGNTDDYYDPRNSFLDQVLERRVGNPITLSILLVTLGQRCGIALDPVGMPGHFIVADAAEPSRYVDAFNGGAILGLDDCAELLRRLGHRGSFDPAFVTPTPNHLVIARMLNNLTAVYMQRGMVADLAWAGVLRSYLPDDASSAPALAEHLGKAGYWIQAATILDNIANQLEFRVANTTPETNESGPDAGDSTDPRVEAIQKLRNRANGFVARLN